jgi:UTP-glucose-1-phosphate uridylyltransferase
MKPTLLILAAGLGTRYGGLKQIDSVGPNGEILIDYAIYDAVKAGFGKLVFVIQHYFERAFKEKIGDKFSGIVQTAYAYQELDACLDGFEPPKDRSKPWGTGHAVLVARDVIHEPFAVINADDYYGPHSFETMARFLSREDASHSEYAVAGYTLKDTLSEYGAVCRGVCRCGEGPRPAQNQEMFLREIVERKGVERASGRVRYCDDNGTEHFLTGDEIVSMNLWGFQPSIFDYLQSHFRRFLREHGSKNSAELFIPTVIDALIRGGEVTVEVLRCDERWFGITYRRDATIAARCIRKLIADGLYPENLWEGTRG